VATEFVTRLPANDLGQACLDYLRGHGVGTAHVQREGKRLGIYFIERGAVHRPSRVIYDREASAWATLDAGSIPWRSVLEGASWFHWTGITPATAPGPAAACREALRTAHEMGVTVSCDLNYRANLWKWGKEASAVMPELVGLCDVVIGNEEDAAQVFGIHAPDTDVARGEIVPEAYRTVCEQLAARFPNVRLVAITLRSSHSASDNLWCGALWSEGGYTVAPSYPITPIVDRVGAGDSFVAGLLCALHRDPKDAQRAVDFATAASALKHTVPGDASLATVAEVEALMEGDRSGRVRR
jgi:2-dehydro-3-deoxygluconokinase